MKLRRFQNEYILLFFLFFVASCGIQNRQFYEPRAWKQALSEQSPPKSSSNSSSQKDIADLESTSISNKDILGKNFYGVASWYGDKFHGKKAAGGEIYNKWAMTAAHKFLPLGAIIEVENLENGKKIRVRINDRGPYVDDRILDLSEMAATKLDYRKKGTTKVKFRILRFPEGVGTVNFEDYKKHVIQVAAFKQENYANRYKNSLQKKYGSLPVKIQEYGTDPKYHVIVGPYQQRSKATYVLSDLKREGINGLVRSYKK